MATVDLTSILKKVEEPPEKKSRAGATGGATAGGDEIEDLTKEIGFLSLMTAQQARLALNAQSLAIIIEGKEEQKQLHDVKEAWHSQLPKASEPGKPRQAHPMGVERRVLLFLTIVNIVGNDSETTEPRRKIAAALKEFPAGNLETSIAECAPKYKDAKEGRKWVWYFTMGSFANSSFRDMVGALIGHSTKKLTIDVAHSGQTQREKKLWKHMATKKS